MFVVPEQNVSRLQLAQKRQPGEKVIGHALGAVGIVRLGRGAQCGHVGEVSEMQHRVGLPLLPHLEHGGEGFGIGFVAVCAGNRQTSAEFSGDRRHAWANGVSKPPVIEDGVRGQKWDRI